MNQALNFKENIGISIDRKRDFSDQLIPKGKFYIEHYDSEGNLKGKYDITNQIKTEGKNKLLDVMFHGVAAITAWFIGLIDSAGWTSEVVGDTLAAHAGWLEFTTYTGSRQAWDEGAAAAQSMTNAVPATFPITGSGNLKGIFVASAASGTSGTLWSSGDFASIVPVTNGDSLKITYTLSVG